MSYPVPRSSNGSTAFGDLILANDSYELAAHISEVANHTDFDYTEVKRQPGQELNAVSSARERVNRVTSCMLNVVY